MRKQSIERNRAAADGTPTEGEPQRASGDASSDAAGGASGGEPARGRSRRARRSAARRAEARAEARAAEVAGVDGVEGVEGVEGVTVSASAVAATGTAVAEAVDNVADEKSGSGRRSRSGRRGRKSGKNGSSGANGKSGANAKPVPAWDESPRVAVAAVGGRFEPTIDKELVAALPPIAFGGEIVIVDSPEAIDRACDELLACPLVGFDTESRPSFQKGTVNRISLLQLSTDSKCFLFRLNKIRLDKAILKVLESTSTIKVGLSVAGDIRELETLRRFDPRGFVDLQKIAPQHGIVDQSLVRIAAITLGRRISKAQRLSNWEAVALTDAQKTYAATDAWICTEIYRELLRDVASAPTPSSARGAEPASASTFTSTSAPA